MWTVTYTYYKKYRNEKQFSTEDSARKFFWYIQKQRNVTSTEMRYS